MSPSRFTGTVLTVLAALLAVPTFLITGATGAGAAASGDPRPAPTMCVNDVERQFNALKHHPEALGWYRRNGAYDPTAGRHYQGIARLPGEGTPRFLTTRNGNAGALEPLADDEPGEVNIVELASRDTNGERVRSNRFSLNHYTQDTPPPNEDQVIRSLKFGGEGPFEWLKYRHLGGLQMWGDVAVLGMDRHFYTADVPVGLIQLIDFSDVSNPESVWSFRIPHQASSIGVAPFGDGRLMVLTTGADGNPVYGYEFLRNGKPTTDLKRNPNDILSLQKLFEFDAAAHEAVGWPTGKASLQTTNLFKDCGTGGLFMLGTYSLTTLGQPAPDASRDRMGLWRVDPMSPTPLSLVTKRQVWCDYNKVSRMCHFAAASGFHVSPGGDLLLYATEHDNDGPLKTVRMAEFSSRDGYDQDRAYRPVAVPGTYKGVPNAPITVDGTGSLPAIAQGRVELYDEPNFGGSSLVIDHPDHGKEDYRHLARVDAQNDEASSVRWRLPVGCEAVLYDDKDYTGPKRTLEGGDGSAKNIANLRSFNDDTTSVRFYGPHCDGRVVSWSWDLGADGTVDATGPRPTVTPRTGGVHPLALTVCSGFGVCHTAVGSIDASAGSLPETTAVVNGTAGNDGWHRSAVDVVLTATGDPAPTEIRYSATGADPVGERVVAGTTATVVVDAQGETTVSFRAVNSSGQEAPQTVKVKVDSVAPTMTVRAPIEGGRYVTGSAVTAAVDCADATSGLATCTPDGSALDTSGTGDRTLNVTATDAAGNTATKPVGYTLVAPPAVNADLVYVARSDPSPGPIQRSNSDGSNVVQLVDRANDPVWSPDGGRIAYTMSVGGVRQVHVMNADGTGAKAITDNTTWQASSPAWSPDGSRIVYDADWNEVVAPGQNVAHHALMTVPSSGGISTTVVVGDEVDFHDPTYARNGATITFVGGYEIRSVPVAGVPAGEVGTLLVGGNAYYQQISHPAWSPDGTTLVFQLSQSETSTSDLYAWNGTGDPVNLTGTEPEWPPLNSPSAPYEAGPTFVADGRLLFVQDGNVYLMAAQRGAQKALLADLPYAVRNVDAKGA